MGSAGPSGPFFRTRDDEIPRRCYVRKLKESLSNVVVPRGSARTGVL